MSSRPHETLPCSLREFELMNSLGDRIVLLNLGASLMRVELALDRGSRNVVLGYATAADYLDDRYFTGAMLGRTCNRIANACFVIDGRRYRLEANDGDHHLHGGHSGFHRRLWESEECERGVCFRLRSADGDAGYPGCLDVRVTYRFSDARELSIEIAAESDRATHVNLTNHTYFNLDGDARNVLDHRLRIASARITAVDDQLLPTGDFLDTANSSLDLEQPRSIHEIVDSGHPLVTLAGGADFNYVLERSEPVAVLESSTRDLRMELTTTNPGLQFYSGQHLGRPFAPHAGLCLEPQHFPDSANQPRFPSTLLYPRERYFQESRYRFVATPVSNAAHP